jgi:hypothetical protein
MLSDCITAILAIDQETPLSKTSKEPKDAAPSGLAKAGRIIIFILSFGMLCPNAFEPASEDNAAREARAEREADAKKKT